ncbi:MAG TPA: murein biosynthesis integral membrane protein MurJ [Dehalococcoidia bacterium]
MSAAETASPPRTRSLAAAAAVVAVGFLGSRLLGVVRTVAIANAFGTDPRLDAYWVAFRIPDLIFQVIAGATLASAFIPTFSRAVTRRGEEEAWRLASAVLNLVTLATAVLAVAAFLAAPWVVPALAPGLGEDAGRGAELQGLAVDLTRLMLLSPILFAVSGMFMGILNARHHFLLPALAPMMYNLSIIAGALLLAEPFGVHGLAVGVVAGAALHLLIQVPALPRVGMRYAPVLRWRDPGVREVGRLMAPRIFGLAAAQANFFLIGIFFASLLGGSAISALNYAWLIVMLPLGLFGMAISTAVFPTLADQAAAEARDELRATLARSLRLILYLTLPAAAGLMLLRTPIIAALLEHGAFDATSTALTAGALLFYALGLPAQAAIEILSRGFYALSDTKTPVALAVLSLVLNAALSALLIGPLEHEGLALALSLAVTAEAALLYAVLRRRLGGLEDRATAASLARTGAAAAVMAAAVAALLWGPVPLEAVAPGRSLDAFVEAGVAAAAGALVFLAAGLALGCEEAGLLARRLRLRAA